MGPTPKFALPWPSAPDPADVPADMQRLAEATEEAIRRAGSFIPGEVKIWPGSNLPELQTFGLWVWANGGAYSSATYPVASVNIAGAWRTFAGLPDPGSGQFRVPDLRGLVPAGMDAMPGGARANRVSRPPAGSMAGLLGGEYVQLQVGEIPAHYHIMGRQVVGLVFAAPGASSANYNIIGDRSTMDTPTEQTGGGGAHENLQPTVFVPYIVKLDDV
jgi:microcystin-dependent protein